MRFVTLASIHVGFCLRDVEILWRLHQNSWSLHGKGARCLILDIFRHFTWLRQRSKIALRIFQWCRQEAAQSCRRPRSTWHFDFFKHPSTFQAIQSTPFFTCGTKHVNDIHFVLSRVFGKYFVRWRFFRSWDAMKKWNWIPLWRPQSMNLAIWTYFWTLSYNPPCLKCAR